MNRVFQKIREKDEYFNSKKYLGGDEENYFEILQQWKTDCEKNCLEQHPHLSRVPIRHKKVYLKTQDRI